MKRSVTYSFSTFKAFLNCYGFKKKPKRDAINRGCYLYDFEKTEDYSLFLKELRNADIYLYHYSINKLGVGATKICPFCVHKKVKVDDWAVHCAKRHKTVTSTDALRRVFVGYKVQTLLYKTLALFLKRNWKRFAVLEGGCYQCLNTKRMFDGSKNTPPLRCVRMDTPKSRMRDFAHIGINIKKYKKMTGCDSNILVGAILSWEKKDENHKGDGKENG